MVEAQLLQGALFNYGPSKWQVAFVHGNSKRHFILLGGLGDGLLFTPYITPLAQALHERGWSLVQLLLSSSHQGYGTASLDQDAEDIHELASCLKRDFHSEEFVYMGHSTGTQDGVRYAKKYLHSQETPPLRAVILQAPVSDREALSMSKMTDDERQERFLAAQLMVSNEEGEEILYRDSDMNGAPITARRYLSLAAKNGDDDCFSSDFTDTELKDKLGHLGEVPTLLLMGGADECVPETVDRVSLVQRLAQAVGPSATGLVIQGGKHNLTGSEKELVTHVVEFLQKANVLT